MRVMLLLAFLGLVTSCSDINEVPYRGTFVNKSSLTLTISPNGQKWHPFSLEPGTKKTVTLDEPQILFTVEPSSVVWLFDEETSTITFYDRDEDPDDDTFYYCAEGATECNGVSAIYYCDGGFWKYYLCSDACADLGYGTAVGCGYSSNAGKDQCFCE